MSLDSALSRMATIEARLAAYAPPVVTPSPTTGGTAAGSAFAEELGAKLPAATDPTAPAPATATPAAVAPTTPSALTALSGKPSKYDAMIQQVAGETGVPAALIKAVATQESDFDPNCQSSAGAQGLMQLMPETQRSLGVTDPFDPLQSLRGGAKELKGYLEQFHGDLKLALAAYNAGPNAVRRYNGIPPYAETQAYVPKVLGYYRDYGGDPNLRVIPGAAAPLPPAPSHIAGTTTTHLPSGYALVPLGALGIGTNAAPAAGTTTATTQQTLTDLLSRAGLAGTGAGTSLPTLASLDDDTGSIL